MSSARLLKLCAWVMILLGVAHLFGHMQGMRSFDNPAPGKEAQLVEAKHGYIAGEDSGARSAAIRSRHTA